MKLFRTALVMVTVGLALSCARKPSPTPATLFPETNEVPGWSKTGATRSFDANDLWRYIDGDAEKYLQAGVLRTLTADYRYQDKFDAVADIHVMGAQEGAKKIFEAESSTGSQPIALGDAGRLYGASLAFRKGIYFVRLVAYADASDAGRSLVELARAIDKNLANRK